MREIKFRLWDKKLEVMYPLGCLADILYGTTFEENYGNNLTRYEVVENTGFKDMFEHEIWVGDIFGEWGGDRDYPSAFEVHGVVYFDEDLGAYCVDDKRGGWHYLSDYLHPEPRRYQGYSKEVEGNIYENPELLDKLKDNK